MRKQQTAFVIVMLSFVTNLLMGGFAMPSQNQTKDDFFDLKYFSSHRYLKGFVKAISGQNFDYHSPHPDVRSSLLSRATNGTMAVVWETEPLPENYRDSYTSFI